MVTQIKFLNSNPVYGCNTEPDIIPDQAMEAGFLDYGLEATCDAPSSLQLSNKPAITTGYHNHDFGRLPCKNPIYIYIAVIESHTTHDFGS